MELFIIISVAYTSFSLFCLLLLISLAFLSRYDEISNPTSNVVSIGKSPKLGVIRVKKRADYR
jgi:hypothetical protein